MIILGPKDRKTEFNHALIENEMLRSRTREETDIFDPCSERDPISILHNSIKQDKQRKNRKRGNR